MSDTLVDKIAVERHPSHNTVYCGERSWRKIVRSFTPRSNVTPYVDNVTIGDMNVEKLEQLPRDALIICQKGDVFGVAGDYKDGDG